MLLVGLSRVDLISTGRMFQAFGAATSKDLSYRRRRQVLLSECRVLVSPPSALRHVPGISATGVTSSEVSSSDETDVGLGLTADYMMNEEAEFELTGSVHNWIGSQWILVQGRCLMTESPP